MLGNKEEHLKHNETIKKNTDHFHRNGAAAQKPRCRREIASEIPQTIAAI